MVDVSGVGELLAYYGEKVVGGVVGDRNGSVCCPVAVGQQTVFTEIHEGYEIAALVVVARFVGDPYLHAVIFMPDDT